MVAARQPEEVSEVAVVIPTVGRPTLPRSVAAAFEDDGVAEVIVVADRGGDAVRAGLAAFGPDPRLRIIAGPGRGAGWARQRGAEVSTARIILFLDDDVVAAPGLASAHARRHGRRDDLVVVGFMPVSERARRASATARVYANDYLAACAELERDPARILSELWAGNVSLNRAAIEQVPLAAVGAPALRREDQAFGLRCARAGLIGVFDRSLSAEHEFERSLRDFLASAREQVRELATLRALYPELTGNDAGATPAQGFAAWMLKVAGIRTVAFAVRGAVRGGVWLAGLLRAGRFEEHGVALLRALVQQDQRARLG